MPPAGWTGRRACVTSHGGSSGGAGRTTTEGPPSADPASPRPADAGPSSGGAGPGGAAAAEPAGATTTGPGPDAIGGSGTPTLVSPAPAGDRLAPRDPAGRSVRARRRGRACVVVGAMTVPRSLRLPSFASSFLRPTHTRVKANVSKRKIN